MSEQLTERYCVLVNGHAVEPGCWVDGHWGQYGPDHLEDRASELGYDAAQEFGPQYWRVVAERYENENPREPFCKTCRSHLDYDKDAGAWVSDQPPTILAHEHEPTWPSADAWERHHEAADAIEQWLNDHTPPLCRDCGAVMYWTSDGFARHADYANGRTPCGIAATDDPATYSWGWHDGEFYLWPTETWEEDA